MNIKNRWIVVVGAIMIQLALGAIYSWSVFTDLLTDSNGIFKFSAQQTAWIFSAGLASFSMFVVISGQLQQRISSIKLTMIGGILLGTGYIFGGIFGSTFWTQLLFIGIVGGAGIGIAYVVPIAVGVKWFPDKKGLITGLAVAGFGFGATIWVKLAGSWFGGLLNTANVFGLNSVQSVFVIYGVVFTILVLLGSLVMVNPPKGYIPEGWDPNIVSSVNITASEEVESSQMLKSPQFYKLWSVFIFSALSGLMVIYCIRLFGIDALEHHGVANAGVITGTAMAWYAIFNGLGRIIWGIISDKIGRRKAIIAMTTLQGLIMLSIYHGFILFGTAIGLIIVSSIIGFNFGGNFALFPAATADYFGNKNVGQNYGFMFTAYGIAGILGPQIAGFFKDSAKSNTDPSVWMTPFIIAGIACLIGALIMTRGKSNKFA